MVFFWRFGDVDLAGDTDRDLERSDDSDVEGRSSRLLFLVCSVSFVLPFPVFGMIFSGFCGHCLGTGRTKLPGYACS